MIAAADDNAEADDLESRHDFGFFLMSRGYYASPYYPDPGMTMMLLCCIKRVRYSRPGYVKMRVGRGWKQVYVGIGQFIGGRKSIAEELGIPDRTAWDRLRRMEKLGTIKIEVDESGSFSLITVVNWEKYQNRDFQLEAKTRQASRQAKADDNSAQANDLRHDETNDPPSIPPSLRQASATNETSNKQGTKQVSSSPKLRFATEDREFAEWMLARIRDIEPGTRQPNLDAWANDIRLTRERDSRTLDDLRAVFTWANADSFWRANVLCPATLRKQFDSLKIKSKGTSPNGHHRPNSAEHSPARYRSGRYGDASKWAAKAAAHRTGESPNPEAPGPLTASGAT